jgi:hypothetical protein
MRKNPINTKTLVLLGAGGAAAYYFLVMRPRQQAAYAGAPPPAQKNIWDIAYLMAKKGLSPTGERYGVKGTPPRCYDYTAKAFTIKSKCGLSGLSEYVAVGSTLSSDGTLGTLTDGGHTLSHEGHGSLS